MPDIQDLITQNLHLWTGAVETKSAAGRGSNNKISLNGIQKLRELILELAVRGQLVPQDPNDEAVHILLKKIASERVQLSKKGEIKKAKTLPDIKNDEKPFGLPSGWEFVRLNDLGDWGAGATPSRSNPSYYGGSIPWFKSGELSADYIKTSEEYVTELALKNVSLRYNKAGDVLIAMYGATIGKTSILEVPATTNQAVCACTPFSGVVNTFLLNVLKAYKSRFTAMGAGGAQPNISRVKIVNTVIALPPTEEQIRIVKKVNELMTLCDSLEEQAEDSIAAHQTLVEALLATLTQSQNASEFSQNWGRVSKYFDVLFTTEQSVELLKQTILQLGVMGKLVPQDPNDEPASELLKKIDIEKNRLIKNGEIKKQKSLPSLERSEPPFNIPLGWKWIRLGEIASFENGDRSERYPNQSDWVGKGIPFFGAKDIVDGFLSFNNGLRFITTKKFDELSNGKLQNKDFVILLRGTVGKIALFNENDDYKTGFINAQMLIIRPVYNELSGYLHKVFNSFFFQNNISKRITGTAVKQMPASVINELILPMPSLAEQNRIVAKVDELMTLCDQLKERLSDAQSIQNNLADTIVKCVVV